jgi:hypothetical protein
VTLLLRVYDSSGALVLETGAGTGAAAVLGFSLDKPVWDPSLGPLLLSDGGWAFSYDGSSKYGPLANGNYRLDVVSSGGASGTASKYVVVLRGPASGVSALAWPNPVAAGSQTLNFAWAPSSRDVDASVYNDAGEKVAGLGTQKGGSGTWNLAGISNGIYFITLRVPGERRPQIIKVALAR